VIFTVNVGVDLVFAVLPGEFIICTHALTLPNRNSFYDVISQRIFIFVIKVAHKVNLVEQSSLYNT